MYYQFKISACRKLRGGGVGSVSMQKIEEQRHRWVQWGGGGGLLTPRPLPSIGPSVLTFHYLTKCFDF